MSQQSKPPQVTVEVDASGIPTDEAALSAPVVIVVQQSQPAPPPPQEMLDWLRSPARLSIGVIRGFCGSETLTSLLACDLVVMAEGAVISASPTEPTQLPGSGLLELLVARVGTSQAMLITLGPEDLDAGRALAIGLVDDVVAPADIDLRVAALARAALARPEGWLGEAKSLLATASGPAMERSGRERLRRLEHDAHDRLARQGEGLQD